MNPIEFHSFFVGKIKVGPIYLIFNVIGLHYSVPPKNAQQLNLHELSNSSWAECIKDFCDEVKSERSAGCSSFTMELCVH